MDYEKKYKEALEWMRSLYDGLHGATKEDAEHYFPELKESEDEIIRKELIEFLQLPHPQFVGKREHLKYIDWLEKQGEQILANSAKTCKTEPKFKVGDFIVNDYCIGRIVEITNDAYLLDTKQGIPFSCNNTHLWDITKDAKDGDVLVSADVIFIFNKVHSVWINCYCSLHKDESFIDEDYDLMHIKYSKEVYPATKEQRDTLFAKMKEAGYEWDAEKKELKKIEQKSVEENKGNIVKTSSNWSEEDEKFLVDTTNFLYRAKNQYAQPVRLEECIDWLKSLKEKLTETKGGEV